jgi:hypothetical protein
MPSAVTTGISAEQTVFSAFLNQTKISNLWRTGIWKRRFILSKKPAPWPWREFQKYTLTKNPGLWW